MSTLETLNLTVVRCSRNNPIHDGSTLSGIIDLELVGGRTQQLGKFVIFDPDGEVGGVHVSMNVGDRCRHRRITKGEDVPGRVSQGDGIDKAIVTSGHFVPVHDAVAGSFRGGSADKVRNRHEGRLLIVLNCDAEGLDGFIATVVDSKVGNLCRSHREEGSRRNAVGQTVDKTVVGCFRLDPADICSALSAIIGHHDILVDSNNLRLLLIQNLHVKAVGGLVSMNIRHQIIDRSDSGIEEHARRMGSGNRVYFTVVICGHRIPGNDGSALTRI